MSDKEDIYSNQRQARARGAAPPMPPFLSTKEFMSLAGITKSQRTNMQKIGVCEPSKVIQDGKHYYYDLDQLQEVDLARVMLASGMRYEDVGKAFEGTPETIDEVAYRCAEENQRASRRTVKRMAFLRKRAKGIDKIVGIEGWYLRYLPNRWFAIIPSSVPVATFASPDRLFQDYLDLSNVAEVVGWAKTTLFGTILSLPSGKGESSSWQCIELSSPPTPIVTGLTVIDGGCYRTVHPNGGNPECDVLRCFECARYGREPFDDERLRWDEADEDRPQLWDNCLMIEKMDKPYKNGMWADFANSFKNGDFQLQDLRRHHEPNPTLRPRLMPQLFKLPMGVTACAMPAGIYLCRQDSYMEGSVGGIEFLETLRNMDGFVFTDEMEDEAIERYRAKIPHQPQKPPMGPACHGGPYLEPFAMPRGGGDPHLMQWSRIVEEGELSKMRIPYDMALWPQEGFIVTSESLPDSYARDSIVKEIQVYVDPGSIGPEGYQVFDGDTGFMKG